MKKILSILLCFILIFGISINVCADDTDKINSVLADTAAYLCETVSNPKIGSVGGEWSVLGLARSGIKIPDEYYENYYKNAENYVKEVKGVLHEKKYTEYSRVIVALTAIGKNPEDVGGYNLVSPLEDYDKTVWQGLNGPVWALIALDSGDYGTQEIRQRYINRILESELYDGGWALSENETSADPDITAMVLTALSNYTDRADVSEAVERGVEKLSKMQNQNGGYESYNTENSESTAQVLTAISTLGISYKDERFVKGEKTLVDNILSFYTKGKGFSHDGNSERSNLMATEQCFYALVAAQRLESGKNTLFDMSDVLKATDNETSAGLPNKNPDVLKTSVKYPGKTFADIKNHKNQRAVEELSERGIINGMTDTLFLPDDTMTRAEFAAIIVKALGFNLTENAVFSDIKENDWFYMYVNTAYNYGIVNGVSKTQFNPSGTITREEAYVMLERAAKLCGMNTQMEFSEARDILAEFIDYVKVSDWAVKSAAFCCREGISDKNDIYINSKQSVTRAEIAQMLYNMLGKADLL